MIARFFRWLFGRQVAPAAQPAPPPERESMSFFSTDVGAERGLSTANEKMLALLGEAMRPRLPMRVLREVAQDGEGAPTFALDAQVEPGIKAEFLVGQTGIPEGQVGWFISQGFIGYQLCALIAQHWLVQRACVMPARDAIRKGYEFKSTSDTPLTPEIVKAITKANKRYKLDANLVQFVKFQRVFGIRVAMFKIESDDPDFYVKPFNPDSIKPGSYRGISQIDPYWIVPELTSVAAMDPASIDFYEPTYWIVGSQRIHKSHLVIIRGPEVADILKPAYLYGGLSIPQQIAERVYAAERTANEAPQLALSKRATVYYTDAAKAMADEGRFIEKVSWWSRLRADCS